MFTADDIKAIRSGTRGAGASSSASSQGFTAADIKKIRTQIGVENLKPAQVRQPYTAPKVAAPKIEPQVQQPKVQQPQAQQVQQPKYQQSVPQWVPKPDNSPEKAAYIADYKAKYGDNDLAANAAYALDNNKILKGADKFIKATNPIASIYRTEQALSDVANKAVNGEVAKPYEVGQHYIKQADEARQQFRDMTGGGALSDAALAVGDMISAYATAGSGGIGVTPYLAATSGIQTAGDDVRQGRDVLPSIVHGVGGGAITYLTEGLGGFGQTKLGQSIVSKITSVPAIKKAIEGASPRIAKLLGNAIANHIVRAGSEGFEEGIEYPAQKLLENIIFDDAAPFELKEWWNRIKVGTLAGTFFEGANMAVSKLANAPVTRVQEGVQAETAQPNVAPVQMQAAQQRNESNQKDINYLTAIEAKDTSGAQAMVDDAAKEAGFKVKAWHGTPGKGFSSFGSDKIGTNTDDGIFGRGFYFTTNKGTADGYAKESGTTMPVFLRVNKPWWAVAKRNIQEVANELGMEESALTLKGYGGRGKIVAPILSQAGQFTAHLKEQGYDSVVVQHGANDYEIVIFDNDAIKLADPVIYDSNGKVVSLSERFKPTNTAEPVQQTLADRVGEDIRSKMTENRAQMRQLTEQRKQLREAQQLKRESYSTLDNAEIMQRLAEVRGTAGAEQQDALRRLAGDIVYSAQVKDNSLAEQYNEARQLIKNTRFKLAMQDRADLGMDYRTFANSNRGKVKLSDNGTPVDSIYMELNSLAPDMFPTDITHPADQLKQISYFMETTAPDFVNPYSEDTESGVDFVENKLRDIIGLNIEDNYDVPPIGLSAEEYAQQQADEDAEIRQDLNERLDQIIKDYEIEMYEEIERLRKADPGVREAISNFIVEGEGVTEGADLSDVAKLLQNGFFYNTDIGRALDKTARAGKHGEIKLSKEQAKQIRDALYEAIEKPWIEAKAGYTEAVTDQINRTADIFEKLGIKPGSKESAAVQWIGEGQRQNGTELEEYTETDLRKDFPDKWKDILEGARAARQIYDEYIDKVNAVRLQMYPEIETRAINEITRLNAKAQAYHANAQAQEQYIAQKRADLARAQAQIKSGDIITQSQLARQRQVLALENTILTAEQKMNRQLERARNYEARASEVQRQIDSGEILRQKRLMPRKDYFHHFTEMAEGFGGLANILNTPSDISSSLAGVSEFTKPKAKFWGALEQRKGGAYTEDAVGGLAKYIPAAEYAVNIDPFIAHMRGTIKNLAIETAETRNANSLITYLTDWTNDLAGKTNKFDRAIMDSMPDRRFMQALNWVNNRVKANAVVGNLSSAVVQVGNIPNAMTYIPDMRRWGEALTKLAAGNSNLAESKFLKERYLGNTLDRLDKKSALRRGAENLLEFGDRQAAKVIWQAAYEQYNKGGARRGTRSYENAADYADDITRRSVAGRGIGELPLAQKSKLIGMVSPFMVEVNNTYHVIKDAIGERDAAAVMTYAIGANLLNALMQSIRGNRPLFDPLDAAFDALKTLIGNEDAEWIWDLLEGKGEEEERSVAQRASDAAMRLTGEVVSNLPYAQAAATLMGSDNSEKLFGENDPTRYGTGNIGVSTLLEPAAQFVSGENVDYIGALTSVAPAYGGKQLERFIKGGQSLGYLPRVDVSSSGVDVDKNEFGASRSASGRIRFPITEPADQFKTMLFGEWSTSRGKDYIDKGLQPLSDKQSEAMEKAFAAGISPDTYYDALLASRKAVSQKDANGKTIALSKDKNAVQLIKQAVPGLSKKEYALLFEALGISKNAY